jgi:glycosyltransferase involved in cell wall biosynthesis
MIRVLFLIRSLNRGGAERQLIELIMGLDRSRFATTLVTFYDGGDLRGELDEIDGIDVLSLHKRGRWDMLPILVRAYSICRQVRPHVLHGYMGVANEIALVAGRAVGARVVWGLRASYMDLSRYDWTSRWLARLGAMLSPFPDLIIINSFAGKEHHAALGYCAERMLVIQNGINVARFHPDREAGQPVRSQWGVGSEEQLIGLVGRLDPMKDHPTFLRAAALLLQRRQDVRFVCVGEGPRSYSEGLRKLTAELGLQERVIWAAARDDMLAVFNALDVVTSSSFGESFSNVIGEAMACGVPCVVTDVGDSARIVGGAGRVVPPRCAEALVAAWTELLDLGAESRMTLSKMARERIASEYSVQRLVSRTESALLSLL